MLLDVDVDVFLKDSGRTVHDRTKDVTLSSFFSASTSSTAQIPQSPLKCLLSLNWLNVNQMWCSVVFLFLGLFNLRGADIEYNPVFFAYAIVGMNTIR